MLKSVKGVALFALASLAIGCAATSPYMKPHPGFQTAAPNEGMAQIVFIRPSNFAKGLAPTIIDANGPSFVGDSTPASYFVAQVSPGEHIFVMWGEGTHALKANVAAGKTYYVEVSPSMGVWSARFHLLALKPNGPKWNELPAWLRDATPHDVLADQGQQQVITERSEDAKETAQKGVSRFAEYNPEEAAERTLSPDDGV